MFSGNEEKTSPVEFRVHSRMERRPFVFLPVSRTGGAGKYRCPYGLYKSPRATVRDAGIRKNSSGTFNLHMNEISSTWGPQREFQLGRKIGDQTMNYWVDSRNGSTGPEQLGLLAQF
jgi:hypothetical protein